MASLTIVRDSGYADRLRKYKVIVDGIVVGEVGNGETKQFSISPGLHEVSLKIDWCGSKAVEFNLDDGEGLTLQAKSSLRGSKLFGALWYVLFAPDSYLLLERTLNASSQSTV